MSQPISYTQATDFESELGTAHGAHLNTEFASIKTTLSQLLANIALIQRDDALIANQTVHPDSLTTASKALIASTWTPKGLWLTSTVYAVGDVVEQSSNSYVCSSAHTSGTFATDKSAGKWVTIYMPLSTAGMTAALVSFAPTGTVAQNTVQAAIAEVAGEAALKSLNLSDIPTPATALANLNGMPKTGGAFTGRVEQAIGASIAAGATVDLSTATGNRVTITGAATITSFGTATAGLLMSVKFAGVCTITYNATSMILPGNANIVTAANDIAMFRSLGTGYWECENYQRRATAP